MNNAGQGVQITVISSNVFLYPFEDRLVLQDGPNGDCVTLQDSGECISSSLSMICTAKSQAFGAGITADLLQSDIRRVYGVLGILRLSLGRFLVYISERELLGTVNGKSIYKASRLEALRIPKDFIGTPSVEQLKQYQETLSSFNTFLQECSFIFSYNWPVSQTQQRWHQLERTLTGTPIFLGRLSDERFYWNHHVAEPFVEAGLERFIVPVTDGFCSSQTFQLRGTLLRFTLISRRSRFRAGVRFLSRGVDPQGNASNFVETEQILELVDVPKVMSWVQIRGSIPVFWTQLGSTTERIPIPRICRSMFTEQAYQAHMAQLEQIYGKGLTLVNLIDQSGQREAHLGDEYEMAVRLYSGPNVRYVGVDFHRLTEKGQYGNLTKLMDTLSDDIVSELWFSRSARDEDQDAVTLQRAVTRTNCIDCLDRTNVVQQVLGRYVLLHQLYLHKLVDGDWDSLPAEFHVMFRNVWTENAHVLSYRYTGASAMKTASDTLGKLKDGITVVERFIEQNLRDPSKQNITNIWLGKYFSRRIPVFTQVANDNVLRVKAWQSSSWSKPAMEYPVGVEVSDKNVLVMDLEGSKIRTFAIDSICALSPDPDGCVLRILFGSSGCFKVFRFPNAEIRQRVLDRLYEKRGAALWRQPQAQGPPVSMFVGFCNMHERGAPKDLSSWIPRDRDLYVLGVSNALFASPKGFVFVGAQFFFFQVRSYLTGYHCVETIESSTGDCMIVMCRASIHHRVSPVVVKKISRKSGSGFDEVRLKKIQNASLAHRRAAIVKEDDSIASPHRRRGTMDLKNEQSQMGHAFVFRVDEGPDIMFSNLWDETADFPPMNLEQPLSFYMGLYRDAVQPQKLHILCTSEDKLAHGEISVQAAFPDYRRYVADFARSEAAIECDIYDVTTSTLLHCFLCRELDILKPCTSCQNFVCNSCRRISISAKGILCSKCSGSVPTSSETIAAVGSPKRSPAPARSSGGGTRINSPPASSDSLPGLMTPKSRPSPPSRESLPNLDQESAAPSLQAQRDRIKDSLEGSVSPTSKVSGIFRVPLSSPSGEVLISQLDDDAIVEGDPPNAQRGLGLGCSFTLLCHGSAPLPKKAAPHEIWVELHKLKLEWKLNPAPVKLRLEMTSSAFLEPTLSTETSDSGEWPVFRFKVYTSDLEHRSLQVTIFGLLSGSAFGALFASLAGSITGTTQRLGATRIPLAWVAEPSFRAPFAEGALSGHIKIVVTE